MTTGFSVRSPGYQLQSCGITKCLLIVFCILMLTGLNVQAAIPVIVAEAKTQQMVDKVEALGTLRANESVTLSTTVSETVSAIHFDDGQRVKQGKVLVELRSDEERAQREEARATLAEAINQLERMKALVAEGTATKADLDERERDQQTAKARLSAVESRLAERQIRAPFSGIVGLRQISMGALVEPGDPIVTLDDDSVMKLELTVPSIYLAAIQTGVAIEATTSAYGKKVFRGEIRSIDSRVDPVTRAITVRAILPNPERLLKPGMLMQVVLEVNPRQAITIPETALVPSGRQQTVFVVTQDNTIKKRDIAIGVRLPGFVEVIEGLAAGEKVVTHGTTKVRPGQTVVIQAIDSGEANIRNLLSQASKQN